jgi:hypothetical protein
MGRKYFRRLIAAGGLAGGVLALGGPAGAAPPSGSYSGASSDGVAVYLVVSGSQVAFGTGLNYPAGCPFAGVTEGGTPPGGVALQGSSFSFTFGGITAVSATGTIDDAGNATGTIAFFFAANPECDVSGTWSASLSGGGTTTTQPTTTQPTTTQPTTTQPTTTQPTTTQPTTSAPGNSAPATSAPATSAPATSGPAASAPTTSAPASTDPPVADAIVSDSTPQAGQQVTVAAPGFQPGEPVEVTLQSTPRPLGTITADDGGVAAVTFTIAADDPVGRHDVVFDGAVSPTVRVPIEIVAAPAQALPATL